MTAGRGGATGTPGHPAISLGLGIKQGAALVRCAGAGPPVGARPVRLSKTSHCNLSGLTGPNTQPGILMGY